jgi:hypothetical protein
MERERSLLLHTYFFFPKSLGGLVVLLGLAYRIA